MLTHLRGPFMGGEIPSGEGSVFHFVDIFALGFGLAAVESLVAGRSLWLVAGCSLAAWILHLIGTKWSRIKTLFGPAVSSVLDRVGSDRRYRVLALVLTFGYFGVNGLFYIRQLRTDLDTYVMPRTVTDEKANNLQKISVSYGGHRGDRQRPAGSRSIHICRPDLLCTAESKLDSHLH
jgi:hypothetical protein